MIIWRGTQRQVKPSIIAIRWGGFKQRWSLSTNKSLCSPPKCIKGECPKYEIFTSDAKASTRYLQILLRKDLPDFPKDRFPKIEGLCFEAIRKFSVLSLRSSGYYLGAGTVVQPVEAQYHNEFYRACYIILNHNVYLTSEWSASSTGGRADFHIPSVGWTIECVRNGDRLEEHIARFKQGGKYHGAILSGQTKQYILLDFRNSLPKKARGRSISFYLPRDLLTGRKTSLICFTLFFPTTSLNIPYTTPTSSNWQQLPY